MKNPPAYSVTLNKETYELLQDVKNNLIANLGFEPTNGQVVRHLASIYFDKKINAAEKSSIEKTISTKH